MAGDFAGLRGGYLRFMLWLVVKSGTFSYSCYLVYSPPIVGIGAEISPDAPFYKGAASYRCAALRPPALHRRSKLLRKVL
jgi:zona occludens toxin (predicted ATPase)